MMIFLKKGIFITLTFLIFLSTHKLYSDDNIVADLSKDTVEISTTFSGAKILLFGAYNGQNGDDIIVTVEGPIGKVKIQKKSEKFGLWAVTNSLTFLNVPKYYYIASNKKISEIISDDEIRLRGLDFRNLKFKPLNKKINKNELLKWRDALIRNMKEERFWRIEEGSILLNKNTLFRKTLSLPSNVTTGIFEVEILHYRDGMLVSQDLSKIKVTKSGIGANIYNIAHQFSTLYGILAVIIAVFFGWFANFIFRRI